MQKTLIKSLTMPLKWYKIRMLKNKKIKSHIFRPHTEYVETEYVSVKLSEESRAGQVFVEFFVISTKEILWNE